MLDIKLSKRKSKALMLIKTTTRNIIAPGFTYHGSDVLPNIFLTNVYIPKVAKSAANAVNAMPMNLCVEIKNRRIAGLLIVAMIRKTPAIIRIEFLRFTGSIILRNMVIFLL